jgi:hypothetical protein
MDQQTAPDIASGQRDYPLVELGDDGVLRLDYGPKALIDLAAATKAVSRCGALVSKPTPILLRGARAMNTTGEAEEYVNGPEGRAIALALALIMSSNSARLAVNLYHAMRPVPYPTRTFLDEAEALGWLRSFLR